MFRLMIMFLLGLSGVFLKTSGTEALSMEKPDMMSMVNDAEDMSLKSKRHNLHPGIPCPMPFQHSGTYLPPAISIPPPAYEKPLIIPSYQHVQKIKAVEYQKPVIIPSYHHETKIESTGYQKPVIIPSYHHNIPKVESIGYQKPVIPKIIYQTIQRPTAAIHHDIYSHMQSYVKPQIQYVQQAVYSPMVKHEPIFHVKPVHEIQSVQTIKPAKILVKEIPCDHHNPHPAPTVFVKPIEKSVLQTNPINTKQYFQPVSYYPKPLYHSEPIQIPSAKFIFQKSNPVQTVKVLTAPKPDWEKIHEPQFVSHVKIDQPLIHNYASEYQHKSMVQQPMIYYKPKIHQPIIENKIAQPVQVFVHNQQFAPAVTPHVNHGGYNYQSPIISANQPCDH